MSSSPVASHVSSLRRSSLTSSISGRIRMIESPNVSIRRSIAASARSLTGEGAPLMGSPEARMMEGLAAPPLLVWIWPALLCALAYALYNIFIKRGSDSIHPVLGGVILQIVAALLGSCLLLGIVCREGASELTYDKEGISWSVCAGLAVGTAEMLSFFVMGMGVQAMQAVPIIIGGSVMFGTVLGYLWLHELLTWQGWFGVVLLVIGIALVATDPAAQKNGMV